MKVFLCWLAILFPLVNAAQEFERIANPEAVYGKLKANSEKVNSIHADFAEIRHVSYLKEPQKSSGRFIYEKHDKMRWEQTNPGRYIILIDGNNLRVSEEGKEKNVKAAGNMVGVIREMLLMMVNGDYQSGKGFEKELFQNATDYRMVLKPLERKLKQRYDRLEMQFSKKTLGLKQLTFIEKGGDRQVMTFLNEKTNAPVDSRLFKEF